MSLNSNPSDSIGYHQKKINKLSKIQLEGTIETLKQVTRKTKK